MRYSVLGFNQQKLVELQTTEHKLDMNDILLMDYIQKALSQPSMIKKVIDNQPYVWLNHKKILEDLPILDIKENMLRKRLSKLVALGILQSTTSCSDNNRGSRTYYTITEIFESLQYDNTTGCKKLLVENGPDVKNYASYKQLNNDNQLEKESISKDIEYIDNKPSFEFGRTNQPKQSLYSFCMASIYNFTNNQTIQKELKAFVDSLSEMKKLKGQKQFTSILNKLNEYGKTDDEKIRIIRYSIEHGYGTFYKLEGKRPRKSGTADIDNRVAVATKTQKEAIRSGKGTQY